MPLRYTKRILDHLANEKYAPCPLGELMRQLRIPEDNDDTFRSSVGALLEKEQVVLGRHDVVQLPPMPDEFEGILKITSRGFGFVKPDTPYRGGDLFIPESGMRDAISGDKVRVRMSRMKESGRGGRGGRTRGQVEEVLQRNKTRFAGTMAKQRGFWFVIPDGRVLREPILARDASAKNVKEGDKVVIDLVRFPSDNDVAEGVIVQVLGTAGEPDVETAAVLANYGLEPEFKEEVVEEARRVAAVFDQESTEACPNDRLDLRDLLTFTIDPPDARDFDDAISLTHDPVRDEYELGVHIADVAHFVKRDGELDKEAYTRGNSAYLPRLVIPMLPELLSNGVCSLQEDVPRFVKSVFITYDASGRVMGHRYHRSLIRSNKRLTYLEAQGLIDGDLDKATSNTRATPNYSDELQSALRDCEKLAKIIRQRRRVDGMLTLSLPESEIVFDENGKVIDAVPEDDAFTHTVIEMFMVAANEAVADLFATLQIPLLRRIHPEPDYNDLEDLRNFARLVRFKIKENPDRKDLQELAKVAMGTPFERAIHFAILKTLTRANYSPALIGHFALASKHYAHFTSPIRRYPDLTVHRAIDAYLDTTDNGTNTRGGKGRKKIANGMQFDDRCFTENHLSEVGDHCSATEKNADAAERSLRQFLILQFLEDQDPGETFPGTVTGTTSKGGIFATLDKYLVDGMVKPQSMPGGGSFGGDWRQDRMTGRLFAPKGGSSIGVGDRVVVQIVQINLPSREMDLEVVSYESIAPPEPKEQKEGWRSAADNRKDRGGKPKKGKRKGYKMGRRGRRGL